MMSDSGVSEDEATGGFPTMSDLRRQLARVAEERREPDMLRVLGPTQALQLDGLGGARIVPNPDPPVVVAGVLVSPALGDALAVVAAGCLAHGLTLDAFLAQAREQLAARAAR
jgi:hypothetical protein